MLAQPVGRLAGWLLFAAVACGVAGWGFYWTARSNADLPPLAEFVQDARDVYLPALQGEGFGPRDFREAWKLTWLRIAGQWDARVLAIAGAVLQALALGFFALELGRASRGLARVGLAGALVALVMLAPLVPRGESAGACVVLVLSVIHLRLASLPTASLGWWGGVAAGTANILASNLGVASALAVLIAAIRRRRDIPGRSNSGNLAALGAMVVAGALLIWMRTTRTDAPWMAIAAWPFASAGWIPLLWAPSVLTAVGSLRRQENDEPPALARLAIWSLALLAVVPFAGVRSPLDIVELLIAAVLINAACLLHWCRLDSPTAASRVFAAGMWIVLVADVFIHPPETRAAAEASPALDSAAVAAVRHAVLHGGFNVAPADLGISAAQPAELGAVLATPELRRVLPASIRPPLAMSASDETGNFRTDAIPELPGRDDLPAIGTWHEGDASHRGEFVSAPLRTSFPVLQLRVAGELRPPATTLVLRPIDGGPDVPPLESNFISDGRWKRVNFPAPRGEFRIVARDDSPSAWMAFTAPQEISRVGWLAGKLARIWPWLAGLAVVLGLAVVVALTRRLEPGRADAWTRDFPWQVLPLVGVAAFAVMWSHHVDPTAGPNDAGGYLNIAKLFSDGEIVAKPRMIWGAAGGETDIAPYVPSTFWPTAGGRIVPEYPPGLPLIFAAAAGFLPLERAVPAVILFQLVLGIYFTRRLALGFGLPEGWAWFAAGVLGMSTVYLWQGLQPQSDAPATVWVTAAVAWAWTSRQKPWHAVGAGVATALAVLIRPSNALVVIPILVCLAGHWRQLGWWIVGGLPGAAWLAWYNRELYGALVATGYGDVSTSFGSQFIWPNLKAYVLQLPLYFSPLVVLGIAGLFVPRESPRARWVLGTWVAVFLAFYACYWCTWDNWYNMRFVMPAAPAMIVLGCFFLRAICDRRQLAPFAIGTFRRSFLPSAAIVAAVFGVLVYAIDKENVTYWMNSNRRHRVAAEWAAENLPRDAVVFARLASNTLYYYTGFVIVRTDNARAQSAEFLDRLAATGRPVHAITYRAEATPGAATGHKSPALPGQWTRTASFYDDDIVVWKWSR